MEFRSFRFRLKSRALPWLILATFNWTTIAHAQSWPEPPKLIAFRLKEGKPVPYIGIGYKTRYGGSLIQGTNRYIGSASLTQYFKEPIKKLEWSYDMYLKIESEEFFAAYGAIRRATNVTDEGAELERIPDEKLPPGLKPVKTDSLFVPYQRFESAGWSNISGVQARMVAFNVPSDDKKATATLAYIRMLGPKKQDDRKRLRAVVKEGDIVLFCDYAYKVRGIVPMNEKTKVTGWVELGPRHYTEAELMESKTPFVRPTEVPDDASWK